MTPSGVTGIVKYENSGMIIPSDFGAETKVTIHERSANEFPPMPLTSIGPVLEFTMELQENGQWVPKSEMPNNIIISLSYSPEQLPLGFNEELLGAAFFSEEEGKWIIADNTWIDKEHHLVLVESIHLSSWVVCTDPYLPDYEKEYGIKPFEYNARSNKTILVREESGTLVGRYVDLTLPTPGKLGFGITRIYNTRFAEVDQMLKMLQSTTEFGISVDKEMYGSISSSVNYKLEDTVFDTFGQGWRLNLPYLCGQGHFHDFNGEAHQIDFRSVLVNNTKEIHGDMDLTIQKPDTNHLIVTTKDGIRITFELIANGQNGRPVTIEEIGNNYVQTILYQSNSNKISSISDSLGRQMLFNYTPNPSS